MARGLIAQEERRLRIRQHPQPATDEEECRVPVGRPDFKSGRGCQQSLVGSTPMLFRHFPPPARPAALPLVR